jgi:hypothetical protein
MDSDKFNLFTVTTSLGSIIARISTEDVKYFMSGYPENIPLTVYDACWVSMRPENYWIPAEDIHEDNPRLYSESEAKAMSFAIDDEPMVEVEGDPITEYIPINPSVDPLDAVIFINPCNILYIHESNDSQNSEYIDVIMGRMKTVKVNDKSQNR